MQFHINKNNFPKEEKMPNSHCINIQRNDDDNLSIWMIEHNEKKKSEYRIAQLFSIDEIKWHLLVRLQI